MGVEEIALLQAASQALQGLAVFCTKAAAVTANPTGKIAYLVGAQVTTNLNKMAVAGLVAAQNEFATTQLNEKAWVASAVALPPIT